jgi:hypothetical protein
MVHAVNTMKAGSPVDSVATRKLAITDDGSQFELQSSLFQ